MVCMRHRHRETDKQIHTQTDTQTHIHILHDTVRVLTHDEKEHYKWDHRHGMILTIQNKTKA